MQFRPVPSYCWLKLPPTIISTVLIQHLLAYQGIIQSPIGKNTRFVYFVFQIYLHMHKQGIHQYWRVWVYWDQKIWKLLLQGMVLTFNIWSLRDLKVDAWECSLRSIHLNWVDFQCATSRISDCSQYPRHLVNAYLVTDPRKNPCIGSWGSFAWLLLW